MQPAMSRPRIPADGAIDLQLHTIYSDGTWTPPQLLDSLVREQFSLGAITDHERINTAATLQQLAQERQFPLVVAAEISASWRGEPTDVLCYGYAQTHHLLTSSGSDSHGPERKPIKYRAEWSRALLERLGFDIQ